MSNTLVHLCSRCAIAEEKSMKNYQPHTNNSTEKRNRSGAYDTSVRKAWRSLLSQFTWEEALLHSSLPYRKIVRCLAIPKAIVEIIHIHTLIHAGFAGKHMDTTTWVLRKHTEHLVVVSWSCHCTPIDHAPWPKGYPFGHVVRAHVL